MSSESYHPTTSYFTQACDSLQDQQHGHRLEEGLTRMSSLQQAINQYDNYGSPALPNAEGTGVPYAGWDASGYNMEQSNQQRRLISSEDNTLQLPFSAHHDLDFPNQFGALASSHPGPESYLPPPTPHVSSPKHVHARPHVSDSVVPKTKKAKTKRETEQPTGAKTVKKATSDETKKGKRAGSSNFSTVQMRKIVDLAKEIKPIGNRSWDQLAEDYNRWAKENGYNERTRKALQSKYNAMLHQANTKPTGDAERLQVYSDILDVESQINEKCETKDLQDDSASDSGDGSVDNNRDHEVVSLSSD
ncbi:hypothetical protein FB446DRAFT_796074, partial [Lentinula raphanica]